MTLRISEICFNCADPAAMAAFWCAALDYHETERDDGGVAIAGAASAPVICCCAWTTSTRSTGSGTAACTSTSRRPTSTRTPRLPGWRRSAHGASTSARATRRGVVLADPEGNELCVLPPGASGARAVSASGRAALAGGSRAVRATSTSPR